MLSFHWWASRLAKFYMVLQDRNVRARTGIGVSCLPWVFASSAQRISKKNRSIAPPDLMLFSPPKSALGFPLFLPKFYPFLQNHPRTFLHKHTVFLPFFQALIWSGHACICHVTFSSCAFWHHFLFICDENLMRFYRLSAEAIRFFLRFSTTSVIPEVLWGTG